MIQIPKTESLAVMVQPVPSFRCGKQRDTPWLAERGSPTNVAANGTALGSWVSQKFIKGFGKHIPLGLGGKDWAP